MAEWSLQIVTYLVPCLPCFWRFLRPDNDNNPSFSGVIARITHGSMYSFVIPIDGTDNFKTQGSVHLRGSRKPNQKLLTFLRGNKTLWPSCTERAGVDIRAVTFGPVPFWARSFYAAVGFSAINQGCYIKPVDHVLTCCRARFAVSQLLSYLATCQADTFQQQQRSNAHRLVHK